MARRQIKGQQYTAYGRTAEEADRNLELQTEASQEISESLTGGATLHSYYWDTYRPLGLKTWNPRTASRYDAAFRSVSASIGGIPIAELTPPLCQRAIDRIVREKDGKEAAAKTIRFAAQLLTSILKHAEDWDIITKSPARRLTVPAEPEKRNRELTMAQIAKIMEVAKGLPIAGPIEFAIWFGLRRGEIAALKWSRDYDQVAKVLKVSRQLVHLKGSGVVEQPLKTRGSKRTLRIGEWGSKIVDTYGDIDSGHILTKDGKPWIPDTITEHWAAVARKAGLEDWHFHDLRHAAASLMRGAGADVVQIASALGHAGVDMTFNYLASGEDRAAEAFKKLGELR